jgi:hypothetical protein
MKKTVLIIAFVLTVCSAWAQQLEANQYITVAIIREDSENIISWQMQREVNTSHFLVEKSVDGIHYEVVSMIKASGHVNFAKTYTYTDTEGAQNCLYRVITVNMEGSAKYSYAVAPNVSNQQNTVMISGRK